MRPCAERHAGQAEFATGNSLGERDQRNVAGDDLGWHEFDDTRYEIVAWSWPGRLVAVKLGARGDRHCGVRSDID